LDGIIFGLGVLFSTPALMIKPFTRPYNEVKLKTSSLYRIVRNPIYLAELLCTRAVRLLVFVEPADIVPELK
jgi:protein-S-isoprenylcysteine O-methyltransferase Ste14